MNNNTDDDNINTMNHTIDINNTGQACLDTCLGVARMISNTC